MFLISNQNEDVAIWFGLGIVGFVLNQIARLIRFIIKHIKYIKIKSIIQCPDGTQKWCECKYADDIYHWHEGYNIVKRYANKNEWSKLPTFSKEEINHFKHNCHNCIYNNKECKDDYNGDIETCLCLLPKEQWKESWNPEINENYPHFERK